MAGTSEKVIFFFNFLETHNVVIKGLARQCSHPCTQLGNILLNSLRLLTELISL